MIKAICSVAFYRQNTSKIFDMIVLFRKRGNACKY